jgi:UDP-N-acetyl-D-mannosaminuronic acid transferase (WecB/TagA/CpsF family)
MKVKNIPFQTAIEELKKADAALQVAKSQKEKRAAALAFAKANSVAKSAKNREVQAAVSASMLD